MSSLNICKEDGYIHQTYEIHSYATFLKENPIGRQHNINISFKFIQY